jgi:hypothetical protein
MLASMRRGRRAVPSVLAWIVIAAATWGSPAGGARLGEPPAFFVAPGSTNCGSFEYSKHENAVGVYAQKVSCKFALALQREFWASSNPNVVVSSKTDLSTSRNFTFRNYPGWKCTEGDTSSGSCFKGRSHIYFGVV